jgi:exodeoxyribonuclease VII small subunit
MSKNDKSFNTKMKELEEIVAWFDSSEVDLDKAVEKFERGTQLAKELKADISEIENRVKVLQAEN